MRVLILSLISFFFFTTWANAAALVQSVSGDVRVESGGTTTPLGLNQRVESGANIVTGADSRVVLKFDDGQVSALSDNTSFKIDAYRFDSVRPEQGLVSFSLVRGALRLLTGLIGERNKANFSVRTATATIGIRGTDFLVGINNSTFVSVNQGAISAANAAGSATFSAGATGMVASATTLAVPIAASALPASIAASFSQLGSLSLVGAAGTSAGSAGSGAAAGSGASGAVGAQGAVAAAAGGVTTGAIAAGAVALGVVATAVADTPASTGTTGTTK